MLQFYTILLHDLLPPLLPPYQFPEHALALKGKTFLIRMVSKDLGSSYLC